MIHSLKDRLVILHGQVKLGGRGQLRLDKALQGVDEFVELGFPGSSRAVSGQGGQRLGRTADAVQDLLYGFRTHFFQLQQDAVPGEVVPWVDDHPEERQ